MLPGSQTAHRARFDQAEHADHLTRDDERRVDAAAIAAARHEGGDVGWQVGVVDVTLDERPAIGQQAKIGAVVERHPGADDGEVGPRPAPSRRQMAS